MLDHYARKNLFWEAFSIQIVLRMLSFSIQILRNSRGPLERRFLNLVSSRDDTVQLFLSNIEKFLLSPVWIEKVWNEQL